MFKNYLLIALRDLKKSKLYSFINVFGLAIGIACCIVIPYNSYLRFDFLTPLKHLETRKGFTDPQKETCVTYLLLNKQADPEKFQEKLPAFALKYYGKEFVSKNTFILHFSFLLSGRLKC